MGKSRTGKQRSERWDYLWKLKNDKNTLQDINERAAAESPFADWLRIDKHGTAIAALNALLVEQLGKAAEDKAFRETLTRPKGKPVERQQVLETGQLAWLLMSPDTGDVLTDIQWYKLDERGQRVTETANSRFHEGDLRQGLPSLGRLYEDFDAIAKHVAGLIEGLPPARAGSELEPESTVRFSPDGLLAVDEQKSTLDVWWPVPPTKDADRRPSSVRLPPDFPDDAVVLAVRSLGHAVVVTVSAGDGTSSVVVSNEEDVVERVVLTSARATAAAHSARGLYAIEAGRCVPLGDADLPAFQGLTEIVALDAVEDALGPAMLAVTSAGGAHFARWAGGAWRPLEHDSDRPDREGPVLLRPQSAPWAPRNYRPFSA